jgi:excisionase family DNA binding protein
MFKTKDDYPMILTVNEVMEILRIGKRVAYELMERKDFPMVRIGRLKRVNRDAFFDWIQKEGLKS